MCSVGEREVGWVGGIEVCSVGEGEVGWVGGMEVCVLLGNGSSEGGQMHRPALPSLSLGVPPPSPSSVFHLSLSLLPLADFPPPSFTACFLPPPFIACCTPP